VMTDRTDILKAVLVQRGQWDGASGGSGTGEGAR
jgi:hypothetical protein